MNLTLEEESYLDTKIREETLQPLENPESNILAADILALQHRKSTLETR